MDIPFPQLLAGGLSLGYGILLGIAIRKREPLAGLWAWLIGTLVLALIAQAIHLLAPDAHEGPYAAIFIGGLTQPAVSVLLSSLVLVAFVPLSLRYLGRPLALLSLALGLLWWGGLTLASLQTPDETILLGQPGWLSKLFIPTVDPLGAAALGGWAFLGLLVLLAIFYTFYTAHLSEIANKALFWLMLFPLILMGVVLGVSGSGVLQEIGWVTQFIGLMGVLYGALTLRVFDIRRVFRLTFTSALTTALAAGVILFVLLLARSLDRQAPISALGLVALALLAAVIFLPLRLLALAVVNRIFGKPSEDTTSGVRQYSQDIAGVVELTELSDIAIGMLRKTLRLRRGGLILATRDDNDTMRVEPMPSALSDMPEVRGWIPKDSPICRTLFEKRAPLLQYDLEYAREYAEVAPELKSFFKQLRMSAYAPIAVQGQSIGILAAGAKMNDDPFSPQDLELLATVATQTGVALRNARLVSDLRKARDETQELNEGILRTKIRLEQLDAVKTDFVTIASHELRTPLAQIRGYTDILDALNDQEDLDPDQIAGIANNLRKATDRLERLIADMLDVSQLGLDAMDLRFATTSIDSVLRLAIEPLAESIKQRKLQLTARGLKALPAIEADMQRLVQAFRNIVLNAIKYTPDGGRIDITGRVQQNTHTKKDEVVVSIKDTGIGIDPQHHEVIFEKFYRIADPGLHSTGATKFMGAGPGLGLTIARGVVEGHGGRIWVESPGHDPEKLPGTTVQVLLPLSPPETAKRVKPFEVTATVVSKTVQPDATA